MARKKKFTTVHMKLLFLYKQLCVEVAAGNLLKQGDMPEIQPTSSGKFAKRLADSSLTWSELKKKIKLYEGVNSKRKFNKVLKDLYGPWQIEDPLSDDVPLKDFVVKIGLDPERCKYYLDGVFEDRFSFQTFGRQESVALQFCKKYGGIYHIYRYEDISTKEFPKGVIFKCVASIRYDVNYKHMFDDDENMYKRIRCKLRIPSIMPSSEYFEYDGYCAPCQDTGKFESVLWQWIFQQRHRLKKQSDMVFMYTKNIPNELLCEGNMMTQSQGKQRFSEPIFTKILIHRQKDYEVVYPDISNVEIDTLDVSPPYLARKGKRCPESDALNEGVGIFGYHKIFDDGTNHTGIDREAFLQLFLRSS